MIAIQTNNRGRETARRDGSELAPANGSAPPREIHYPHEWGMTLCGRDGWRSNWSSWDNPHSLPNTMEKRKVTCRACRRKLRGGKAQNAMLNDGEAR